MANEYAEMTENGDFGVETYGVRLAAILNDRRISVLALSAKIKNFPGQNATGGTDTTTTGRKRRNPAESTMSNIIRGRSNGTLKTVQPIADALGKPDDPWLLDGFNELISRIASDQSAKLDESVPDAQDAGTTKPPWDPEQAEVIAAVTARQVGPSYSPSDLVALGWLVRTTGLPELELPDSGS
jgi:transcriptional regulator with XRE-family HTH domain